MKQKVLLFLLLLSISGLANAEPLCGPVFTKSADNTQVVLMQQVFDGGVQELAINYQDLNAKKKTSRLSFAGSKEAGCHFPSFALLKGGDWGWHVVWTSSANQGVFYARVDGEAWVSSLPKKLSRAVAEQLAFKEIQGNLIITAKYPANLNLPDESFISDDEGRNWDLAPIK
jgi:hypothetical protein